MTHHNTGAVLKIHQAKPLDGRGADASSPSSAWRVPFVMPMAAVLTVGLMLSMSKMIATEFSPQDKSEVYSFQINPVVEEPPIDIAIDEPDPLVDVEIPPARPKVSIDPIPAVKVASNDYISDAPPLTLPPIEFNSSNPIIPDKEAQPLVRIPPTFPTRFLQGNHSGYCEMRFNVSAEGKPYDVAATNCTHNMLEGASKKAVLKWSYAPKIQNGGAVARQGVQTRIRFDLSDERGKKLPLPSGF